MSYEPISYEAHLARGTCCHKSRGEVSYCYHCPWKPVSIIPKFTPDPRILAALESGETVTIESDRMSLVPQVILCDRVTINYKKYQPK